MENKKIIFFDLDGTLLNSESQIIKENILEINKIRNKGFFVSIATGRSLGMTIDIVKQLSINVPVVLANGNFIYNPISNNTTILSKPLHKKVKKFYLKYVVKNKGSFAWFTKEKDYFYSSTAKKQKDELLDLSDKIENLSQLSFGEVKKKFFKDDVYHMSIQEKNNLEETRKVFYKLQEKNLCKITIASGSFIDADDLSVNKFAGLKKVLDDLKITDLNNVYCFGDSNNDIEMLKNIPNSIAMGNANEDVKKIASKTIGTNNEPSIANFLKTL
ncbi:Cof-type HAD-IIB family hydrolase [Malacoplasma iowae]|uniref:Cof-type HAD-IIB family hydrolase n=1 Tax=Malacoplasma iowae 695 TaxID=1048830 RepID=A0A6P1LCT5_MALIO|nr:Cof-type HAD-IIB family hydrolase [Malacoplasma iowae]VEU61650.1 haloacid dehalogenase-like hydrolase [Mycoplasmopsis fermentans]EGZ31051.1 HAD family phosphatase [Malacoplasma iowae 695]QHG90206.1 Cof-type HAD-IIB family hydrolase [Malacoplasma iowae 695]WPL36044.1 Cof-type HAD-IIB family hydrolase [Malacoplasma iowae]VEU71275.1 haloacid dehalogenase-like hydrolase [Malacoplasma iowae]